MYLMSRSAQLTGADAMEWATAVAAHVTEVSGNEIQLWTRVFSPEWGTVAWTSWWPDLTSLEAGFAKLMTDKKYVELGNQGRDHVEGKITDALAQAVTEVSENAATARYVGSIQAQVATGSAVRGFVAGVELAEKVGAITGNPVLFARNLTGPYGGVAWFQGFADIATMEASGDKLAADPDFATYLDSTKGCFVEGSGESLIWMRAN